MSAKPKAVKPVKKNTPTGRTTSPPAPRQRGASDPQQSVGKSREAGAVGGVVTKPVGTNRYRDPTALRDNLRRSSRTDVELKIQQMITNAATKEQYDTGSEELPPSISCVAFDSTGDHMAYGDRAGRCYIFCRSNKRLASLTPNHDASPSALGYTLVDVVDAYQPQLDTLNSTEIEAKVNVLKFIDLGNGSLFFLTANDKTIKMWKIWERAHAVVEEYEPVAAILEDWNSLKFPGIQRGSPTIWHKEMKVFAADHEYHVNSISCSANRENFLTSDDLTVQLWHLGHHEKSLRVLDQRPDQMEELSETITATAYHTIQPQEFCVANSKGVVSLYDLRTNLTCTSPALTLPSRPISGPNVYLSTILAGISDVKYSPCGTYIIARDYMNVNIWDARKEAAPVRTLPVHDGIQPRLTELYEHDYVFDRFEVVTNGSGEDIYTGSYRSEFVQFGQDGSSKLYTTNMQAPSMGPVVDHGGRGAAVRPQAYEDMDFQSKTLHLAAHPREDVLAVGCGHELFLYTS